MLIGVFVASCSSPSSTNSIVGKASVSASVSVSDIEDFVDDSNLVFRMYNIKSKKWFVKLLDNKKEISIKINNLDIGFFTKAQIAILKDDKYDVRIYYGDIAIRKMEEQIILPHMDMTIKGIAPEFLLTKIEDDIFYPKCYNCHNSIKKDANLDLSKWNSYDNMVNVDAFKVDNKKLIIANDVKNSFCYLLMEDSKLLPDMAYEKLSTDELDLLRQWINAGAPRY